MCQSAIAESCVLPSQYCSNRLYDRRLVYPLLQDIREHDVAAHMELKMELNYGS